MANERGSKDMCREVNPDKREALQEGITKITSGRTGSVVYEANWSWVDESGERRWGRKRFPTLKEAKLHRARMVTTIATGGYEAPSKMTVSTYVVGRVDAEGNVIKPGWLRRKELDWAPSTAYTRRYEWDRYLAPKLGHLRLRAVTRTQCQEIINTLDDAKMAPTTIRNVMALMGGIFRGAVQDGLITKSPATRLEAPRITRTDYVTWSREQLGQFLAGTREDDYYPLYHFLATTGVRLGEAVALRWASVDLDRPAVVIAETKRRVASGGWQLLPGTKSGNARIIVLTAECAGVLRAHKARQDKAREASTHWDDRGIVFTRPDDTGKPIHDLAFRNQLKHHIDRLKLPALTPHGFRHTLATLMLHEGVHERDIQDLLGHAKVSTTLDLYAHVSVRTRMAVADRIASIVSGDATYDNIPAKVAPETT